MVTVDVLPDPPAELLPPPQAASDVARAAVAARAPARTRVGRLTTDPARMVNRFMSTWLLRPVRARGVMCRPERPRRTAPNWTARLVANDEGGVTGGSGTMPLNGKQVWSAPHS